MYALAPVVRTTPTSWGQSRGQSDSLEAPGALPGILGAECGAVMMRAWGRREAPGEGRPTSPGCCASFAAWPRPNNSASGTFLSWWGIVAPR